MSKKEIAVITLITVALAVGMGFFLNFVRKNMMEDHEKERLATVEEGKNIVRQEAVTVGVARWTADEKGKPKFEWVVPVEKKP